MIIFRYVNHCIAWWSWALHKPKHETPHALVRDAYWINTRAIWADYHAREPRWQG